MKTIKLTQGKEAIVDNEDYDWLNQYKWHYMKTGYAARKNPLGKPRLLRMHREIYKICNNEVDHANGNKLDNRKSNLREATHQQNSMNNSVRSTNKSGYKGVSWRKDRQKWRAYIVKDNKQFSLGMYTNIKAAAIAYNNKARELFGDFVRLNKVEGVSL